MTSVFELTSATFVPGDLRVVSFRGVEEMSGLYRFDVLVRCPAARAPDLERELLGQRAALTISGDAKRVVTGVVSRVTLGGAHEGGAERSFRLRLVPSLWFTKRVRRSRVFQGMDVVEIVTSILTAARVAFRKDVASAPRKREYCVQYQESDLDFVLRLLAEEGIYGYFSHTPEGEVFCFLDEHALLPFVPATSEESTVFTHREHGASQSSEDDLLSLERDARVRPGRLELRDHDFKRPQAIAPVVVDARHPIEFDERTLEVYEHQGEYEGVDFAAAAATRRLEALRVDARTAVVESRSRRLVPGHVLDVASTIVPEAEGRYVVTRVEHEGKSPEGVRAGDVKDVYRNRARLLPAPLPPRPRAERRRVQQVTETATVIGPEGKDIHTDEYGRVQVRFHWQRSKDGGSGSCWLRTMQAWAGTGWGTQFIPRIGMEVVVTFVGGDVDRPLVLGSLPNVLNPLPFTLPGERTKSGIRTQSSPGGSGYNELSFEDRVGFEQVHVRAERDMTTEIRRDALEQVGRHATQKIEHNSFVVVGGDRVEAIGHDRTAVVSGNSSLVVERDATETVRGKYEHVVEGPSTTRVNGSSQTAIGGDAQIDVDGSVVFQASKDVLARVHGSLVGVVGSVDAPQSIALHAEGDVGISGSKGISLRSLDAIDLCVGDSVLRITPGAIELHASSIVLRADGASTHLGDDKALVLASSTAMLKSDDKAAVYGSGSSVVLTGDAMVGGGSVKLGSAQSPPSDPTNESTTPTTVELVDADGNAVPNARFTIRFDGGREISGVLDEEGKAKLAIEEEGKITFPGLGIVEDA